MSEGNAASVDILLKSAADASGVKQMEAALNEAGQQAGESAEQMQGVGDAATDAAQAVEAAAAEMERAAAQATAEMHAQFDELFEGIKAGVADALTAQGADTKFVSHVIDEFDRLNRSLKETGASGDEVVSKIAKLEQSLTAAAAVEERRIRQLQENFKAALHEKDVEEEAATRKRILREEDQLYMEQEEIRLRKNTELLEQQIMTRLKEERVAREAVENAKVLGGAMQGVKRDIGGALLVGSQFVDDMQYGLRAVTGQIPQLAAVLGLGTGLAGVIGIAAVATNLLWDKFGSAKEAKADTEKTAAAVDALKASLDRSTQAAKELFEIDLAKRAAEIDKLTQSWSQQAAVIKGIVADHNELARLQIEIANHKLEIARQDALAGADTKEKRDAINADFDARKATVNDTGKEDAAKRSLEAQKVEDEMLRRQQASVQNMRDFNGGDQASLRKEKEGWVKNFGDQSDQGRRVREAEDADKRLRELQEQQRQAEAESQKNPAKDLDEARARADEAQRLQEKIDAAARDRETKNTGIEGDKAALASGNGLTFNNLDKEAEAKKDTEEGIGLRKVHAEALRQQGILAKFEVKYQEEAIKLDEELKKIKEAILESEKKLRIRQLQLEEASLGKEENEATRKNKEAEAKQKAADEAAKKKREEEALRLENEARLAEKNGNHESAAELRNKAEWAKLPPDATAEQRRKAALDAEERRAKAKPETTSAASVVDPLQTLAANLGPAGAALGAAVNKLKDGASGKELDAVIKHLEELAPLITKMFEGSNEKIKAMEKKLEELKQKVRSAQL